MTTACASIKSRVVVIVAVCWWDDIYPEVNVADIMAHRSPALIRSRSLALGTVGVKGDVSFVSDGETRLAEVMTVAEERRLAQLFAIGLRRWASLSKTSLPRREPSLTPPRALGLLTYNDTVEAATNGPYASELGPYASQHLPGKFDPRGCAVVGHRGFGMNRCPGRGIRENTIASFIAAHSSGAQWCEFDVQVTADGVPVLWHDSVLIFRRGFGELQEFSIRELRLEQVKALSRAAMATAAAAGARDPAAMAAVAGAPEPPSRTETSDTDDEGAPVVFYRKFPVGYGARLAPEPEPWIMDVEDEIPTLEELMTCAPRELGMCMELKFDEAKPCPMPKLVAELRAILAVCRAHSDRRITFSSFDPDAALLMRTLQGLYPVMLLSDCRPTHEDPRRCSVEAARNTALEGGLCGLVLHVDAVKENPEVVDDVRKSGLLLGTYGKDNDSQPLASKQVEWGMCYVCTDNVAGLAEFFNVQKVATVA